MPLIVAAIGGMLLSLVGSLVGRVLVALGIGVVSYMGFSAGLDWMKSQAISSLQGLPADAVGMLSIMKVGVCISIVSSALMARLVLSGLTGDTVKKWVHK
jgi:hypothetical protein